MTIKKVISGGQRGVDEMALMIARNHGLETGGTVPRGCRTEAGPNPELLTKYGCKESYSSGYNPRTARNVKDSDGTLLIGEITGGTALTQSICIVNNKPYISNPTLDDFRDWVEENKIQVLNVAGNRLSKNPDAMKRCVDLLVGYFQEQIRCLMQD